MSDFIQDPVVEEGFRPVAPDSHRRDFDASQAAANFLEPQTDRYTTTYRAAALLGECGIDATVEVRVTDSGSQEYLSNVPDNTHELLTEHLQRRHEAAVDLYERANALLPELKERTIEGLAAYGSRFGYGIDELRKLFESRLAHIREVEVRDWAIDEPQEIVDKKADRLGSYQPGLGRMYLPSHPNRNDYAADEMSDTIVHELEHAASFIAGSDAAKYPSRSGLSAREVNDEGKALRGRHGKLTLDEGAQDDILLEADLQDPKNTMYVAPVMFWRVAVAIDPSIEKLRFDAKFLNSRGSRGELVGRIENIFGPYAVEHIEEAQTQRLRELPRYKKVLLAMIEDSELRETAKQVLDTTMDMIAQAKGYKYSDSELEQALEDDIVVEPNMTT